MEVLINFDTQTIYIDREDLDLSFTRDLLTNLPENVTSDQINEVWWGVSGQNNLILFDHSVISFGEDKYNDYVKPYVDLWQAEKDRIAEEQAAAEAEYNKFENRQLRAYAEVRAKYKEVTDKPYLISSIGFTIDANSAAYQAIDGLINRGETVENFKDYYNTLHQVTVEQMKIMRDEIVQQDSHLKTQKWDFLAAIENAKTQEELDSVIASVNFTYLDFSGAVVSEIIL